ncbi:hypothetical protein LLE87_32710, partial [Paenibacillus polymyxa]|nr:hypothetical protein [Paenibacillus polymyxa]
LISAGGGGHEDRLRLDLFELVEAQGVAVLRRRQAEAIIDQRILGPGRPGTSPRSVGSSHAIRRRTAARPWADRRAGLWAGAQGHDRSDSR